MQKISLLLSIMVVASLLSKVSKIWAQSEIETIPETTILGSSNIHDWKITSSAGKISLEVIFNDGKISQIKDVKVIIPVVYLKSDKGKKMDKKLLEALKNDKFPEIKFSLDRIKKIEPINGKATIYTEGYLEIAGQSKLVELIVNAETLDTDTIQIKLTKKIKMTDFGIKLPIALFGLIKTDDEVTVHIQFKIKINESQTK